MPASSPAPAAPARAAAVRWFGRLQLLKLLGKSERTMAWRVLDAQAGQELVLVLPRTQPAGAAALEHCTQALRLATRLNHPHLAKVVQTGVQDGWPYVTYDPVGGVPVSERLPARGLPATDAAAWAVLALQGLAYAHEAGIAHQDVQPWLLLTGEGGQLQVAGLGVASEATGGNDTHTLRNLRAAAERDVLSVGVLLHHWLAGTPALDEPDAGRVIARLPPLGRDVLRLPWATAHPVPEPLRAIANRTTDRQERQRYRNARTLLRALEGWQETDAAAGGGPLALLADKLRVAGVLPSLPGAAARAARLALMERERTNELAEVVLQDLALSFELLRLVNSAQVRGAQVAGTGPILTVRRAIAMLGLDGVRRAALGLRPWPGPLSEAGADELRALIARCKRAGQVALALRPGAYDGEVVYLITLLQNLGRLVVHYHFAEEAAQIRRLMQPGPPPREGESEDPGMGEEGAAYAVLGTDIETLGAAVARHWGLDDSVLSLIRRQPLATAVRTLEGDDDTLRALSSCANEAVDALQLPQPRVGPALQRVVSRYGRALDFNVRDLQAALQAPADAPVGVAATAPAPLTEAAAPPGSVRGVR